MTPNSLWLYRARTSRGCSRWIISVVAVLCVWTLFAGEFASAQTDRGSVSGTVTDSSGAGITGAKVTITNAAMGTQRSTVTSEFGGIPYRRRLRESTRLRWLHLALPRSCAMELLCQLERQHVSTCN